MAPADSQQDLGTGFRSFRSVRQILVALAVLYALVLVTHQSLLPVFLHFPVLLLGCVALILAPALVFKHRSWKSACYATVLLIAFPVWFFSLVRLMRSSHAVNNERAQNFIAQIKEHTASTGVLPTSEKELAASGLSVPRTMLGVKMTYHVFDSRSASWRLLPAGRETGITNYIPKHPPFSITYSGALWLRCEHFSHADYVHCND